MKKIVIFGGGTGLSYLLSSLKNVPLDITVAVTIADNGGSTGKIRADYDIPAPGDLRRAVLALSEFDNLEKLMNYRFDEKMDNHTIGNLILTALVDLYGDMHNAVQEYSKLLNVKQKIIPISNESLQLSAIMQDGQQIEGETAIAKYDAPICKISYCNAARINKKVLNAVENADAIILSSGSLYTSTIPNLIFPELQELIFKNKIKVIYTANIMTQPGETSGYSLSDHINAINMHFGKNKIDTVIANSNFNIPQDIKSTYEQEGSELVKLDPEKINCKLILNDFLIISNDNHIRHNVDELSKNILKEVT